MKISLRFHVSDPLWKRDKKINLALKSSVNVHAAEASRTTAQGRPADVRGDGLHTAGRMPLARSSSHIWTRGIPFTLAGGVGVCPDCGRSYCGRCWRGKLKAKLRFVDTSHIKVHQDASNPAGGQQNQAIGSTKGGLNTKLSAWVDSQGQPVSLSFGPGTSGRM